MKQPTLATTRLTLRPADTADLSALHALWSDAEVRRFLFDDEPVSLDLARSVLASLLSNAADGLGLWLVEERGNPGVLGCVGLNPTTVAAEYEPSLEGLLKPLAAFWPRHWHKGYARESLSALVSYAFDALDQSRLAAVNDAPNVASERMLLALGFVPKSEVDGPRYRLRTYLLEKQAWESRQRGA